MFLLEATSPTPRIAHECMHGRLQSAKYDDDDDARVALLAGLPARAEPTLARRRHHREIACCCRILPLLPPPPPDKKLLRSPPPHTLRSILSLPIYTYDVGPFPPSLSPHPHNQSTTSDGDIRIHFATQINANNAAAPYLEWPIGGERRREKGPREGA